MSEECYITIDMEAGRPGLFHFLLCRYAAGQVKEKKRNNFTPEYQVTRMIFESENKTRALSLC
jgi:hypothetical protein